MRQLKIATQITNRDSQAVEKYLQEISKIPMITPEEETILAQKIKMGDQRALERLTLIWLLLLCRTLSVFVPVLREQIFH